MKMKIEKNRQILAVIVLSLIGMCVYAASINTNEKITGVYTSLAINEESGDVVGMEVVISESFSGNYFLTFQSSEGQPREPVVSKVFVDGDKVKFSVDEANGYKGTFEGVVSALGLKGQFLNGQLSPFGEKVFTLKRQSSFWERVN